ncbi:hypothetical protein SGRIM128S_08973 [Streptomyces griseomycini]
MYEPSEITGVLLAPGLVHLTYETRFDGRHARRSSLWRKRDESGLAHVLHQGTPVPPEADQGASPGPGPEAGRGGPRPAA